MDMRKFQDHYLFWCVANTSFSIIHVSLEYLEPIIWEGKPIDRLLTHA